MVALSTTTCMRCWTSPETDEFDAQKFSNAEKSYHVMMSSWTLPWTLPAVTKICQRKYPKQLHHRLTLSWKRKTLPIKDVPILLMFSDNLFVVCHSVMWEIQRPAKVLIFPDRNIIDSWSLVSGKNKLVLAPGLLFRTTITGFVCDQEVLKYPFHLFMSVGDKLN